MAITQKNFQSFYTQYIEPELGELERKRIKVLPLAIVWRILFVGFFVLIISVFTGVILRLKAGKDDQTIIYMIRGFFSFLLTVVLLIVSGYLVKHLKKKNPERFTSLPVRIFAVIGISAVLFSVPFVIAYKLTENMHGVNDISFGTLFKTAALIIFVVFPLIGFCIWRENKFYRLFKNAVIARLVPFISPGSTYDPEGMIPRTDFEEAKLFSIPSINYSISYKGSDYIQATINNHLMEFSLLNITSSSRNSTGGRGGSSGSSSHSTIFKGIFLRTAGSEGFAGETIVRPNTVGQRVAGKFKSAIHYVFHTDSKAVKTGDEAFDKEFIVYTTREEKLNTVLTSERKAHLLSVRKQWSGDLHFSFIGQSVSVAVSRSEDDLKPAMFRSVMNYDDMLEHYTYLQQIYVLAELSQ
jgi:hypothetical protein